MRMLASLLNVALLGFVCYKLAKNGMPMANEIWIALLLLLAPIANLLALRNRQSPTGKTWFNRTWLGLFLERKRLEEELRIKNIHSGSDA